jgi:RNA polymerase sigma factor (sigma-70 family)
MSQTVKETRQLLRAYAEHGDEGAFHDLVDRYSRLVYSAALRQVGDPHAAEDITQLVFTNLARQARTLPARVVLGGWLYRDAVFTASKYRRSLARRRVREEEAAKMIGQGKDAAWKQIAPLIEEAMTRLGVRDRNAIVLRFFEEQPFSSVGAALGITENAARMRVERALEKLRHFFVDRGVVISATGLAGMLANDALASVPPGTMTSIAANALHHAGVSTLPDAFPACFASRTFKFAMAGVVLMSLVTGLVWQFHPRTGSAIAPVVSQSDRARLIQIKGGIRRTTSNPPSMSWYSLKAISSRSGEQVAVTNAGSNYKLLAKPTITAGGIKVESSLIENASDPSAPAIRFPSVVTTNGAKAVVSSGTYSFEFTTSFTSPAR